MLQVALTLALALGASAQTRDARDQLENAAEGSSLDGAAKKPGLSEDAAAPDAASDKTPDAVKKKPLDIKSPPPVSVQDKERLDSAWTRGAWIGGALGILAGAATAAPILWFAFAKGGTTEKVLASLGSVLLVLLGLHIGQDAGKHISKENEQEAIDAEKPEPPKDKYGLPLH